MADYLSEALAQIQQQSLASNPYAQFGSVLSQQKNPYAVADDPWSALAANAAQQLVAGVAGGYGQAQVGREMQQIAPLVPQLYSNPMAVSNPGLDDSVFGNLQVAAQNQRAARQRELEDLFLSESVKQNLNPQAPLFQIQAQREKMKYAQELAAMLGIDPSAVNAIPSQAQAGQVPTPDQVFKAPPAAAPTQQSMPQAPAGVSEYAVPNQRAETQRLMATGMSIEDASKQANENIQKAIDANRQLKLEGVKEQVGLRKLREEEDIALSKTKREEEQSFDQVDLAANAMARALKNFPNYAGALGGIKMGIDTELAANFPEGDIRRQRAAEKIAAVKLLQSAKPVAVAPLRKEVLSGSTSNFDVQFLLDAFPGEFDIKEANAASFQKFKNAVDIRKVEKQARQIGLAKGRTEKQIVDDFNAVRAKMGGSFVNPDGSLKPQFQILADSLGATL